MLRILVWLMDMAFLGLVWRMSRCRSVEVSESSLKLSSNTPFSCTLECELAPPTMREVSGLNFSVV